MDQQEQKKPGRTLFWSELLHLLIKLIIVAAITVLIFTFLFGLTRNQSLNMQPAVQDGDLLLYYRIVPQYQADQIVIVKHDGRTLPVRVVATAGDTVNITPDGLTVNGSVVVEPGVIGETTAFVGAVTFPLTVPTGQVFLLGDNRENAIDSRVFGCVDEDDIQGKVIGLFRRRNF